MMITRLAKSIFRNCNSILRASMEKGSLQKLLADYKLLLIFTNFNPNVRTYAILLKAFYNSDHLDAAMEVHSLLTKLGLLSSQSTLLTSLFQSYVGRNRMTEAKQMFQELQKLDGNPLYGNLLILGLMKHRQVEEAYTCFKQMPAKDLVSWNTMMNGLVKCSHEKEAMSLFDRMVCASIAPDGFTFSSVLSACARVGARDYGHWVHGLMVESGLELNHILVSALIDMYAKCGQIDKARDVFDMSRREHLSVWNTMIGGFAIHGLGQDALDMFVRMEDERVAPDGVTFVAILTGCSYCCMADKARDYFDMMTTKYGINPTIEHYGALVDSMARSGRLDEAFDVVKTMSLKPDTAIWRTLLSACRRHRHVRLAEMVMGRIACRGSGDYVLLSSMYSFSHRWHDAATVWDEMKGCRIRKAKGLTWVEIGGATHEFASNDRDHPESDAIHRILNGLSSRVRAEGYVPVTELVTADVSEEEREEILACHSEKLAVAYSVMKTAPMKEVTVSKNLQTCEDCHEWMKRVSKVLRRVIVMRDRVRFHRFEDGLCSCNDFW